MMPITRDYLNKRAELKFYEKDTATINALKGYEAATLLLTKPLYPYTEDRADGTKTIDVIQDIFIRSWGADILLFEEEAKKKGKVSIFQYISGRYDQDSKGIWTKTREIMLKLFSDFLTDAGEL